MKKIVVWILAIVVAGLSAQALTLQDVQDGKDRRECIIIDAGSSGGTNITYMAETAAGSSATAPVWVCSKIIETTNALGAVTIITSVPGLQTPGAGGTNLPGFNYTND
jgi:hypothetical protein